MNTGRQAARHALLAAGIAALTAASTALGWLAPLDDRWAQLVNTVHPAPDIVLITLEDDAPHTPHDPASSPLEALLRRLLDQHPRAVALDLPLALATAGDEVDTPIGALLAGRRDVVLAVPAPPATPSPGLAALARFGHDQLPRDSDGRIRHYQAWLDGDDRWPALALVLLDAGGVAMPALPASGAWRLPASTPVRQLPARHVIAGSAPDLRGRWVLVVPASAQTVAGAHGGLPRSAGAYHALALQGLLQQRMLQPLAPALQAVLAAGLVVLALAPGPRRRAWMPPAAALALALLLAWSLPRLGGFWFAPASALVALTVLGIVAFVTACAGAGSGRRQLHAALRNLPEGAQGHHALLLIEPLPGPDGRRVGRPWQALDARLGTHARRPHDLVARLGRHRSALLLPTTSPDAAQLILDGIRADAASSSPPLQLQTRVLWCQAGDCSCALALDQPLHERAPR